MEVSQGEVFGLELRGFLNKFPEERQQDGELQAGAAQMSWVDGACRPAVNQSGFAGNGSYISSYRAQAVYGGEVARVITENPGQDAVVWGLKYGGVKTEMMTDARVVLKY